MGCSLHRDTGRRERRVRDVRAFPAPDAEGQWPCHVCGEAFAVERSWQLHLDDASSVVSCGRCADHARRNGRIAILAGRTIRLDATDVRTLRPVPDQPADGAGRDTAGR